MKKTISINSSRRQFCTKAVTACSAICLAGGSIVALDKGKNMTGLINDKHIFDQEWKAPKGRILTHRLFNRILWGNYIDFAKALEQEWGKEKTIAFIKRQTEKKLFNKGERQAKISKTTSLESYVKQFRGGYKNSLIKEVVKDTKTIFELKVTDCIWASTFLKFKAGDIGFARICYGDYAWATGFNPKIKLIRDKTLMQGHNCCNHQYVWTG